MLKRRAAAVGAVTEFVGLISALGALIAPPDGTPGDPVDADDPPPASVAPASIDDAILGDEEAQAPRLRVESVRGRLTFFDQTGRGYQSKAGPPQGPGSEKMWVVQPMGSVSLRQRDERFSHQITMAVDIVSAASPDALDAVSSASKYNEAATLDGTSNFEANARDTWSLRYGVHVEEHWRTGFGGIGYAGAFNEDNTVVSASVNFIYDYFDDLHPRGWNDEQTSRVALNDNLSVVQVLSPTTLAMISYGVTFQMGTLENGWNSVYVADAQTYDCFDSKDQSAAYDCPNRRRENLPRNRVRHAAALQLAQHVPRTRSTLKARYRHYRDDYGLRAHTLDSWAYQWLGRRFYLRLGYRFHHQSGVDVWTRSILERTPTDTFYTADSDLARFNAHEPTIKGVFYITPPGTAKGGAHSFDLGYGRYFRSNNLQMNVFSVGYGREF